MLDYVIPLVESWLPVFTNYLLPIFGLAFLVWVKDFLFYLLSEG